MLICSLQKAHFPLKKMYENTGMLCHHFRGVWHFGHFDAGNTIDSSLNVLKITTFKKLPMHSPVTNTSARIAINAPICMSP